MAHYDQAYGKLSFYRYNKVGENLKDFDGAGIISEEANQSIDNETAEIDLMGLFGGLATE